MLKRKGKHIYLKVFESILEMDHYDEAALKAKFTGEKTLNNFSIAKKNLYEKLMDMLCSMPHHQDIESQFDKFRQQISILVKKSLYKQALGRVKKAIKLAEKLEAYKKVLDLHDLWREIARNFLPPEDFLSLLKDLRQKETWIGEVDQNLVQYKDLFDRASIAQKIPRNIRGAMISGILGHRLMQDESECLSVSSRLYFYRIWNHLYFVQGKDSGWKFFTEKIIALLNEHQHLLSDPGKFLVYVNTITDYAFNCIASKEFAQALEAAEKLMNLRKNLRAGDNEALIFSRYWKVQLLYCQTTMDEKNGLEALEKIDEGLRRFRGKISKSDAMELTHIAATFLLILDRSSEAIHWILQLREDRMSTSRPDLHHFSWLLFLIAHFNLGHMDVVEQQVPGTIQYLRSHGGLSPFNKRVTAFFRKAVLAKDRKDLHNRMQKLRDDLMKIFADAQDLSLLGYFDIIAWIDARLASVPLYVHLRTAKPVELSMLPGAAKKAAEAAAQENDPTGDVTGAEFLL
ncbi:MAG: hypothetical protein AAF570_09505 [Bacteroidota bacterium]